MTNEITFETDSPTGPRVTYSSGTSGDTIDAECPEGWEVDWETSPARDQARGTSCSPLVRSLRGLAIDACDAMEWNVKSDLIVDVIRRSSNNGRGLDRGSWRTCAIGHIASARGLDQHTPAPIFRNGTLLMNMVADSYSLPVETIDGISDGFEFDDDADFTAFDTTDDSIEARAYWRGVKLGRAIAEEFGFGEER